MKFWILLLVCFSLAPIAIGQVEQITRVKSPKVTMIMADFGANISGGDMAARFGSSLEVGGGLMHKTKSNWLFGISAHYFFGNTVYEDSILDFIRNEDGNIIGADGFYAEVRLTQRGIKLPELKIGRMIPLKLPGANASSGLFITGGVGVMQHKIYIIDDSRQVAQLSTKNKKGLDRLSNGMMLSQSLGYIYLSRNKLINFYLCLDFAQAFTQNRREINVDTGLKDESKRRDLLWGIKFGWIFPLYERSVEDKFYYN